MAPIAEICHDILFQERNRQNSILERLQAPQPESSLYLLLDGAYPGVYEALRQTSAPDKAESLFSRTPYEHMASKGAWLVRADAEAPLLRWYLDNPLAGAVLESPWSLSGIAGHLRSFLEVVLPEREKKVVLFRFCDPRILADFLPSLDAKRLEHFLAPFGRLWIPAYSEGAYALNVHDYPRSGNWIWHEIVHSPRKLDESPHMPEDSHYGFVMLSPESRDALLHLRTAFSFARLRDFFSRNFPHRYFLLGERRVQTALKMLRAQALKFDLKTYEEACVLLRLFIQYGWGVMEDPRYAEKESAAQDAPLKRLLALEQACAKQQASLRDTEKDYGNENYALFRRKNLALLRTATLYSLAEGVTEHGKLIRLLYEIFPESKRVWNEHSLRLLSNMAVKEANMLGYTSVEATICIALLLFFFGTGAVRDPFQPWIFETLSRLNAQDERTVSDTIFAELQAKGIQWLYA